MNQRGPNVAVAAWEKNEDEDDVNDRLEGDDEDDDDDMLLETGMPFQS